MAETSKKTIVILGATSAVAEAYARLLNERGGARFVLVGRDDQALKILCDDLVVRGAEGSFIISGAIGAPDTVPALFNKIMDKAGQVDEVLLAYGLLGDQTKQQASPETLIQLMDVNLVSAALWAELFAAKFEELGKGQLTIIGSVAGDRGRQSNYLYGATKGALERIVEGMAHRFAGNPNITATLVKPGFIDSPMTDHIEGKGGPLWATPHQIAKAIDKAVAKKRVRIYAPWFWRFILLIVRSLPTPIMHKTKM